MNYVIYMNYAQTYYDVSISTKLYKDEEEFYADYASSCKVLELVPQSTTPQITGVKLMGHLMKGIGQANEEGVNKS